MIERIHQIRKQNVGDSSQQYNLAVETFSVTSTTPSALKQIGFAPQPIELMTRDVTCFGPNTACLSIQKNGVNRPKNQHMSTPPNKTAVVMAARRTESLRNSLLRILFKDRRAFVRFLSKRDF
jgi:hypothetical protein